MLFLLFRLGTDRYVLESSQVVEVLPVVDWKAIPRAIPGVAGVFNFHGSIVPLIDLARIALDRPSQLTMSTRIILVNYIGGGQDANDGGHLLGIIVEEATATMRRSREEFVDAGVGADGAPYLGPVTRDETGIIQWIDVMHLLSEEVREQLFSADALVR